MGLTNFIKGVFGISKKQAPVKSRRKFKRRTYAQIEADRVKEMEAKIHSIETESRLNKALRRAKMMDGGEEDQSWSDIIKDVAPDLVKVFAGNIAQLTQQSPKADTPAQLPETASIQPGDETMDTYSRAILPNVRGKSPEDAAAWLRAAGKSDPVMGRAVIGRLVKTPESGLRDLLTEYEAFAPAFIQYCRANFEWFVKTVRCLKPPTNIAPVDPLAAAL
jgi:hypothetical protein